MSNTPSLVFGLDGIVECNTLAAKMLGKCTKQEVLGNCLLEFSPPFQSDGRSSQEALRALISTIKSNKATCFEWDLWEASQEQAFPVEIKFTPIVWQGQSLYYASLYDLSHLKQTERSLKSAQKQLQSLFDVLPLGVVTYDTEGNLMNCNPISTEILGISQEEHKQRGIASENWEILKSDGSTFPQEEYPIRRVMKGEKQVMDEEMLITRPDGSRIPTRVSATAMDGYGYALTVLDNTQQKEQEHILSKSHTRLQMALEASSTGLWEFNIDDQSVEVNDVLYKMLGYKDGKSALWTTIDGFKTLIHADDRKMVSKAFADYLSGFNSHYKVHMRLRCADGGYKWVRSKGQIVKRNAKGIALQVIGTHVDIDQLKQQELQLRDSKDYLATSLDAISDALITTDTMGRIEHINPMAEKLTGFDKEGAIGQFINKVLELDGVHEGHECLCPVKRVLQSGKKVYDEGGVTLINKQGKCYHISYSAAPIHNNAGNLRGVILNFKDESDRYEAQATLERERNLNARITENTPAGIFLADARTFQHLLINKQFSRILGYTLDELKTLPIDQASDFFHPDDKAAFDLHIQKVIGQKQSAVLEHRVRHRDGHYVSVLAYDAPFAFDEEGNVNQIIGSFIDNSANKEARDKLEAAKQTVEQALELAHAGTWYLDLVNTPDRCHFSAKGMDMLQLSPEADGDYIVVEDLVQNVLQTNAEIGQKAIDDFSALAQGEVSNSRIYYQYTRPSDEQKIWIEIFGEIEYDADGQPVLMKGVIQDVTEFKAREEQLNIGEKRLGQAMKMGKLGAFKRDLETGMLEVDQTGLEIVGLKEVPANPMEFFFSRVHPQYVERMKRNLKRTSETQINTVQEHEFKFMHPSKGEIWIRFGSEVLKDEVSQANGVEIGFIQDITASKEAALRLMHEQKLSSILTKISSSYLNSPVEAFDESINKALQEVGAFLEADRAYLFQYREAEGICTNTHEWCRAGVRPQIDLLQDLSLDLMQIFLTEHKNGQAKFISNVGKIEPVEVRAMLEEQDIKSLFTVPVFIGAKLYGFIGFDAVEAAHHFNENDLTIIDVFAQILSNMIQRVRSEKEKQEQHEFLMTLIQSMPDMVFAKNIEGIYTMANPLLEEFSGKSYSEIIGATDHQLFSKEVADEFRDFDRQTLDRGRPHTYQERISYPSGLEVELETTKTPIKNSSGEVIGLLGLGRDITERRMLENTMKSYQERLESRVQISQYEIEDKSKFLEFAQEQVMTLTKSTAGVIFLCDEDIQQLSLLALSSGGRKHKKSETIFRIDQLGELSEIIEKRRGLIFNKQEGQEGFLDGILPKSHFTIERFIGVPVFSKGKIVALVGAANKTVDYSEDDLSEMSLMMNVVWQKLERYEAERAIRDSQSYLMKVLNAIPAGVSIIDTKSRKRLFINSTMQQMLELDREEIKYFQAGNAIVDKTDIERITGALNEKGAISNWELKMVRTKSREEFWTLISAMRSNFFGTQATLITMYDINENKKLQLDLEHAKYRAEEANKAKSAFLANMSHEIRTPMNSIIGFSEVLGNQVQDPAVLRYLENIKTSGKTLLGIINDILDLSKIESGKIDLKREAVSLRILVEEMSSMFGVNVQQKNLRLATNFSTNLPDHMELDELRIRQVLINLLSNAFKFTDSGEVRVSVEVAALKDECADILIKVSDTGIGISDADQKKIFESFQQAEDQDTRKYGGTGLGLSISRRIVSLMGGRLSVKSTLGVGSTFSVYLPGLKVLHTDHNDISRSAKISLNRVRFEPATVLVVDDVEENRQVVKEHLQPMGLHLISAKNGREALDVALELQPDLVLMDLRMPVMDGYMATKLLKADTRTNLIPVVALTASAYSKTKEELTQLGFHAYLRKPVLAEELVKELCDYLPYTTHSEEKKCSEVHLNIPHPEQTHELLEDLKKLNAKHHQVLHQRQSIKGIKAFNQDLKAFVARYNIEQCHDLSSTLEQAIASFDIGKVKTVVKQYLKDSVVLEAKAIREIQALNSNN